MQAAPNDLAFHVVDAGTSWFSELMDEFPARESFEQTDKLMQGLTTLSPRRLDKLLA